MRLPNGDGLEFRKRRWHWQIKTIAFGSWKLSSWKEWYFAVELEYLAAAQALKTYHSCWVDGLSSSQIIRFCNAKRHEIWKEVAKQWWCSLADCLLCSARTRWGKAGSFSVATTGTMELYGLRQAEEENKAELDLTRRSVKSSWHKGSSWLQSGCPCLYFLLKR